MTAAVYACGTSVKLGVQSDAIRASAAEYLIIASEPVDETMRLTVHRAERRAAVLQLGGQPDCYAVDIPLWPAALPWESISPALTAKRSNAATGVSPNATAAAL